MRNITTPVSAVVIIGVWHTQHTMGSHASARYDGTVLHIAWTEAHLRNSCMPHRSSVLPACSRCSVGDRNTLTGP